MALWTHKNIEAHVWPLDHCPPHVTFVSRDGWAARMKFSMVDDAYLELWDVKPVGIRPPASKLLNQLAEQLLDRLLECRGEWWRTQQKVCLDNSDVRRVGAASAKRVALCDRKAWQGRIVARSGMYRAAPGGGFEVVVSVRWSNGTTTQHERVEA